MTDEYRRRLYNDAVAYLISNSNSFASFADFLYTVTLKDGPGVAATDGKKFYIGLEFGRFNTAQRAFIIAHEINHIVLRHPWRGLGKDHYLWNIAADFVINDVLHMREIPNIPLPGKPITIAEILGKAEGNDLEVPPNAVGRILYDPSLEPLPADEIYKMLDDEAKKRGIRDIIIAYGKEGIIGGGDIIISSHQRYGEDNIRRKEEDSE